MILLSTNHPHLRFPSKDVFRALKVVYQEEGKRLPALAVIATNHRFIRSLNKKFLSHNYSTDVLAFPMDGDGGAEGEIYINLDAARSQAKKYHVTYTQEARRLLIHGALHLLGYSDKSSQEKARMNSREDFYLALINRNTRMSSECKNE